MLGHLGERASSVHQYFLCANLAQTSQYDEKYLQDYFYYCDSNLFTVINTLLPVCMVG